MSSESGPFEARASLDHFERSSDRDDSTSIFELKAAAHRNLDWSVRRVLRSGVSDFQHHDLISHSIHRINSSGTSCHEASKGLSETNGAARTSFAGACAGSSVRRGGAVMRALKRRLAIHRRLRAFQQWGDLARKLGDPQPVVVPTLRIIQLPSGRMACIGVTASAAPGERCSPPQETPQPPVDAPRPWLLRVVTATGLPRFARWLQRGSQ